MKRIILYIIGAVLLLAAGFYALNAYIYNEKQAYAAPDYKDAEYIIEGERIRLQDGVSGDTKYFGNEVRHDLNNDGREDVAFLLTHSGGGSGTFYYVVAALNTERGYVGSEGLLLGDRIAPQTTEVSQNPNHKGVIVVNYADRAPGEPMAATPTVGKSIWLKLDPDSMQFGEVAQNFEGEADPNAMTLGMKAWVWVNTVYADGRTVTPKQANAFSLDFENGGRFAADTDCNNIGGSFEVNDERIAFKDLVMTKMFCEGSQEMEFAGMLENAVAHEFTSRGELIIELPDGIATFR